jgi:hypothetical protein
MRLLGQQEHVDVGAWPRSPIGPRPNERDRTNVSSLLRPTREEVEESADLAIELTAHHSELTPPLGTGLSSFSCFHLFLSRRVAEMKTNEQKLEGGNVSAVWRVGDTVCKPGAVWDVGVQALLRHLEEVGFDGAPRALGTDELGRSIVSFIAGDTYAYPLPAHAWDDDTLVAASRLLRAYHDATVGFVAPPDAGWQGRTPPGAAEVVCHNDVAPYNMVFRNGRPVALIDFEMAAPGPRVWDAAYAAYRFVSLGVPADDAPPGPPCEQGRRLALFMRSYDAAFTAGELLDAVVGRLAALCAFMQERAAADDPSFARHIAEGHAEIYERDAQYLSEQRGALLKGVASAPDTAGHVGDSGPHGSAENRLPS